MNLRPTSLRCLTLSLFAYLAITASASAGTIQAWLLHSGDWRDSVVSTDPKEKESLEKNGWKLSGTGNLQSEAQKGAAPLHRFARAGKGVTDRMLESNPAKVAQHLKNGYTDEGVLGYVSSEEKPGLKPVHHFTKDDLHFWLIDLRDQPAAEERGWKASGVSFWLWPVAETPAPAARTPAPAAKKTTK